MTIPPFANISAPSRRTLLKAGAFLAAAPLIARVPTPAFAAPVTIRFATAGGVGPSEPQTMVFSDELKKSGVLKNYGKDYTVEFINTRNAAEGVALLAAGQADIAAAGFVNLLTAVRKDAVPGGISVIADLFQDGRPGWASNSFFVLDDSSIKTVQDLKGKVIGVVAFGTPLHMALQVVLKKAGLDPKTDVKIVEVSFPNMGPALREKRVDAGSLVNPFMASEQAKGGVRPLFNYGDAFGPMSVLVQAARNDFLKANGPAVKAYLADYVAGTNWLLDPANQKAAGGIGERLAKAPEGSMSYFGTNKDYFRSKNGCLDVALIQGPIDSVIKAGIFEGTFDASKIMDLSYLPQAC